MGFSNVKGIGEAAARKIVENQPYSSFEDFLDRFGTQATILKPLIGLGLFKDADRATLWEFAEHYKTTCNKRLARDQRSVSSRAKIIDEFKLLLNEDAREGWEKVMKDVLDFPDKKAFLAHCADAVNNQVTAVTNGAPDSGPTLPFEDSLSVWKTANKYKKNVEGIECKKAGDSEIRLADFKPTGQIDETLKKIYGDIPPVAESQYYGFGWDHVLEYSPDYKGGMTLSRFEDESKIVLPVEVQVVKPIEEKISKKNTKYYSMVVEDANWQQAKVNVWEPDYERFKEEFGKFSPSRKGNLLRMRLERPSGGFPTYTFESPPRNRRHKDLPEDKKDDHRVVVLRGPWDEQETTHE